jgi:hypothetical protein
MPADGCRNRVNIHRIIVGFVDLRRGFGEPHMREAHPHAGGVRAFQGSHATLQKCFHALLIFALIVGRATPFGSVQAWHFAFEFRRRG